MSSAAFGFLNGSTAFGYWILSSSYLALLLCLLSDNFWCSHLIQHVFIMNGIHAGL